MLKNLNLKSLIAFPMIFILNSSPITFSAPRNTTVEFTSSNLPIIIIDTFGQTIRDQYRIEANMKIIYNGKGKRNYLMDPPNNYDGRIAIELRGSATLSYPKKGYRFETQDTSGNNLNVSLLDMPKENDWVLYGPYDDQSLIRNVLAYRLSNDIGRYASRTQFCELVLNDDYRGIYVLMEKIKRDKNRVNVSPMDSTAITGDAVTGGYIIKIDKESGENVGGWRSSRGISYQYHYPKADEIISEQKTYIRNFMNQFETAMSQTNVADSTSGYPRYLEVASFVDHFILNEFCKNIDAYRISFYMFKDRDSKSGKLNAGPIWDFNLSFGKTWFAEDAYRVDEWEIDHNRYKPNDWPKVPFWWERLGHNPEFARQVELRWRELRKDILQQDSLYHRIDLLVDTLSEARVRNFERWPETAQKHSYEQEIQLLKQWINDRIQWIEANLGKLTSASNPTDRNNIPECFQLKQNYPNPFNSCTTIEFSLPEASFVTLNVYNLLGEKVATLVSEQLGAGYYRRVLDAGKLASGVYLYRLQANGSAQSKKLILLDF
ncbi:MAG: CotH kinase family protein [candidate division KSB1 bacterium]|nr:CotH kinase family protein [candidate division KSB1 bacterium]